MLTLGIKNRLESVSTEERSAEALGSGNVPVYATIMMIGLMEKTCLDSVLPFLEPGQDTVGVHVNVSHCKATPVGMKVWCESELVEIDRRRLVFRVAAYDERGLIGEGTHERFIIDKERFLSKAYGQEGLPGPDIRK
jgi:predicted thioesterase